MFQQSEWEGTQSTLLKTVETKVKRCQQIKAILQETTN